MQLQSICSSPRLRPTSGVFANWGSAESLAQKGPTAAGMTNHEHQHEYGRDEARGRQHLLATERPV